MVTFGRIFVIVSSATSVSHDHQRVLCNLDQCYHQASRSPFPTQRLLLIRFPIQILDQEVVVGYSSYLDVVPALHDFEHRFVYLFTVIVVSGFRLYISDKRIIRSAVPRRAAAV